MTKSQLTAITKFIKLPAGWKVQKVYPGHTGKKKTNDYDIIIFGCPIAERMALRGGQLSRKIGALVRQLNDLRKPIIVESQADPGFGYRIRQPRWSEFGTGFGGGLWYDIKIGKRC